MLIFIFHPVCVLLFLHWAQGAKHRNAPAAAAAVWSPLLSYCKRLVRESEYFNIRDFI